jgi:hypothetical protein
MRMRVINAGKMGMPPPRRYRLKVLIELDREPVPSRRCRRLGF